MRLQTFKVKNCFGFRGTEGVDLSYPGNLVYILGRNSSGKTALLTAIEALGSDQAPDHYARFENFDSTGEESALIAEFTDIAFAIAPSPMPKPFGVGRFISAVKRALDQANANDPLVTNSQTYKDLNADIIRLVTALYEPLFAAIENVGRVWVKRGGSGDYSFSADEEFADGDERLSLLTRGIEQAFIQVRGGRTGDNQTVLPAEGGGARGVNLLTAQQIENLLWKQFPAIVRFDQRETFSENLPDGITITHLTQQSPILSAFLDVLDRDTVRRALTTHNQVVRNRLVTEMQVRVEAVTAEVNEVARMLGHGDLIKIGLATFGTGLQITVTVGNDRPSYYRQISDNTKLLFAYNLLQKAKHINASILLFDEPNNGFHATAQEELLRFLKTLAADGKQVIVATHSEHLIDLDHLAGVRRMVTDAEGNYLGVRNKWNAGSRDEADVMALRPVLDAIGLRFGASQLTFRDHLIVTEGASELYYLRAFRKIFGGDDLHLVPANGDSAMKPIVALIIGQGLHFKVVVDTQQHGKSAKDRLQEAYGIADASIYEIAIPSSFESTTPGSGIEDVFSKDDFKHILTVQGNSPGPEFDTMANSAYMNMKKVLRVPKLVVARWFSEVVGEFTPTSFDSETQDNIRSLLDFCENAPWFRI